MATQLTICNLALLQLGGEKITALNDGSRSAKVMDSIWEPIVKDVLRDHNWNFAKKRVLLSTPGTTPVFQWAYAFALPADCLKVVCVGEPEDEIPWKVEGPNLLCDDATANLLYVRYVGHNTGAEGADETSLYDSKFVLALAYRLAAEAAEAITGRTGRREEMLKFYQMVLADAATAASQEQTPEDMVASSWIDARN